VNKKYLIKQVVKIYDIEEASDALVKLSNIDSIKASELSYNILLKKEIDKYFEATAMMILYKTNIDKAIDYIESNYKTIELYVLGEFISTLTTDSIALADDKRVINIVVLLKGFIKEKGKAHFKEIKEEVDWFLESFK